MFAQMIFPSQLRDFLGSNRSFWGGNVNFGSWVRPLFFFGCFNADIINLNQGRENTPKNLGPKVRSLGIFVTQCTCFGHPQLVGFLAPTAWFWNLGDQGPLMNRWLNYKTKMASKKCTQVYLSIAWMLGWNPEASWGQWLGEILFQHLLEWGRVTILYPIDSSISTDDEVDVYPGEFDPPASLRQMPLRNRRVC